MRVLALDTTTRAASVALVQDDRVLAERAGDPSRTHAEQLPGELLAALDAARVPLETVDVFAVAAGPGSFTGLRIGIATMQGLAFVQRRRIVAVSSLEALAQYGSGELPEGAVVAAWMDARRRDVFAALYLVTAARRYSRERLVELDPPSVGTPAATLARWRDSFPTPALFIGDGAVLYQTVISGQTDHSGRSSEGAAIASPPLAAVIGRMAISRAAAGESVAPAGVQPLYVRRPDAELARDAQARAALKER